MPNTSCGVSEFYFNEINDVTYYHNDVFNSPKNTIFHLDKKSYYLKNQTADPLSSVFNNITEFRQ